MNMLLIMCACGTSVVSCGAVLVYLGIVSFAGDGSPFRTSSVSVGLLTSPLWWTLLWKFFIV